MTQILILQVSKLQDKTREKCFYKNQLEQDVRQFYGALSFFFGINSLPFKLTHDLLSWDLSICCASVNKRKGCNQGLR